MINYRYYVIFLCIPEDRRNENGNGRKRGRPENMWTEIIGEDMMACGVDENLIRDMEKKKIRVSDFTRMR